MSSSCDSNIFRHGTPLCAVDTGPVGGADRFETYIEGIREATGSQVDWHYSGGRAQVLVLGDPEPVRKAIALTPLPEDQTFLKWFNPGEGLYRNLE